MKKLFALAGIALVALSTSVAAKTITWTVQDATFDDGGTIVGSFDWDTTTDRITAVDIQTTAGQVPFNTAQDYTGGSAVVDLANSPNRVILDVGPRKLFMFGQFDFDTAGTIALQGTFNGFYECLDCNPFRRSIGGASLVGTDASPIPLPASLPILMGALGGLALVRRRRKIRA